MTLPLVGDLVAFRADAPGFLLRIAQEQGDIARFRLGRRDAFLLSHPDQVRTVLVDHAAAFTKGNLMQRARRLLGDGLLTSERELHHAQRRRIQPVFARHHLPDYTAVVPPLAETVSAQWQNGVPVRLDRGMDGLAMRIVAQALLGADIEAQVPELAGALHRLARWAPVLILPGGRALERSRLPGIRALSRALEIVERVVDQRIADGGTGAPLLSALLSARADGSTMPPRLVRDEVMTIFLAGHDTTAAALTWIWLLLGTHPAVRWELRREIVDILAARDPEPADYARLAYTDMVVREALRLYPPIGRIGRRPMEDLDIGPVVLPKGAPVFVSPYVTQRDPRWFPEPTAFLPARWAAAAPERPRFAWFPFGAGPRSCVGEHFARQVLVLTVATIARRWRLIPTVPTMPRMRSLLTLKPRGPVWMVPRSARP